MTHFRTDMHNVRSSLCREFNSDDNSNTAIVYVDCPDCLQIRLDWLRAEVRLCEQRLHASTH